MDKEYGFKRYLNDLRYSPELINDISLEIDKVDDSTNLESKYREVFKNYGAAVLCVPIEDVNFFYSDNNIDTNTKIIYFLKILLARLISHYYSDTLSGSDSEIEVYMDNEFERTVERFINIDK